MEKERFIPLFKPFPNEGGSSGKEQPLKPRPEHQSSEINKEALIASYKEAFDRFIEITDTIAKGKFTRRSAKKIALEYVKRIAETHSPVYAPIREEVDSIELDTDISEHYYSLYSPLIQKVEKSNDWSNVSELIDEQGDRFITTAGEDTDWENMGNQFKRLARFLR